MHILPYTCWPKTNILPGTSPAKVSLLWITKKLQFRASIHSKRRASPCAGRRGKPLLKRGKGSWEGHSKQSTGGIESSKYSGLSLVELWQPLIGWALARKKRKTLFFLLGFAIVIGCESSPFWPPDYFNWSFRLSIFIYQILIYSLVLFLGFTFCFID